MQELSPELTKEAKEWVNRYVDEISKEYFEKPYSPRAGVISKVLDENVGGYLESVCSSSGCEPKRIVYNKKFVEMKEFEKYIPLLHEKTHEALIRAYPYLPFAGEALIEGLTNYVIIEKFLKDGKPEFATKYYETLSPEYKSYYHLIEEIDNELRKSGLSIKDFAKYCNDYAEKINKGFDPDATTSYIY